MPLNIAGVLKLIEQPVIKCAVETVLEIQPVRPITAEQHTPLGRGEQNRQIAKHQPTGPAHPEVVLFFERVQQPVNPLRAGKPQLQFPGNAVAQDTLQFVAKFYRGLNHTLGVPEFELPLAMMHRP